MNDNKNQKRTTIKEVAKKAGVSVATVSRVMNNQDIVKEEKKQKVLQAISDLNFVPNPAARTLGKKQVFKVAVIVPNIMNYALADTVKGISQTLHNRQVDMMLFNSDEDPEKEKKAFLSLSDKLVEGVIFIAQCGPQIDFSQMAKRMPIVLIERAEKTNLVDRLEIDNDDAMRKIVGHLYELGHRKIAYISGEATSYNTQNITKSFLKALKKYDLPEMKNCYINTSYTFSGGKKGLEKLLDRKEEFTAIVCSSNVIAIGVVNTAIKLGYKIPEDFSISGYDSFPEIEVLTPAITTIDYPAYGLGVMAAEAILEKFDSEGTIAPKQKVIKVELVKGESTGPIGKKKTKKQ